MEEAEPQGMQITCPGRRVSACLLRPTHPTAGPVMRANRCPAKSHTFSIAVLGDCKKTDTWRTPHCSSASDSSLKGRDFSVDGASLEGA